jgi:hypothetical protein
MKNRNGYQTSDYGTVRALQGEFYDSEWNSIFVPYNNRQFRAFLDKVELAELEAGRRLSTLELRGIINEFEADSP